MPVHFLRRPGADPDPTPLLLTHGWPWTFWHWAKVLDPLADPGASGGDPAEAFEVLVPSFPGFGFSSPLSDRPDMNFWKVADLWYNLVNLAAHDHGGHFIPWEIPDRWVEDLRRTFRGRRQPPAMAAMPSR